MSLAFSLYLTALHISIIEVGLVAATTMLFMVFLTMLLGIIGDRKGYRAELVIAETFAFAGALIIAVSSSVAYIIAGMIIAGLSGSAGGMRGAFSPGTNAFVANNYKEGKERVRKYSLLTMTASAAAVGGSIIFSLVSPLSLYVGLLSAYRYLFVIAAALLGVSVIFLMMLHDAQRPAKTTKIMKKSSIKYSLRMIVANSLGGVGMGLVMPLLPLWFKLSYGASPLEIGIIFSVVYIATASGSYVSSAIAHKFNALNISSYTRMLSGLLLFLMAISPALVIVALVYVARAIIAGFGSPSRTSVNVRGIDTEDYGAATSVQGIASRAAQLSSGASGYLMDYALPVPIFIGGIFQLLSGVSYKLLFKDAKKQGEEPHSGHSMEKGNG
ncbi:MFS transporter [Candidatus Marsarchaeota archaeon]|nr:MFS transporter [Candidatus Marsarchaeota archaeon]MCL5100017.1 MFS transporter [Candidatus Marsarchaeota archaeon]